MIKNIKFKFGSSEETNSLHMDVSPITIFVGPNNSGKSKVIQEINQYCVSGHGNQNSIVEDLVFSGFDFLDAQEIFTHKFKAQKSDLHDEPIYNISQKGQFDSILVNRHAVIDALMVPNADMARRQMFAELYLRHRTIMLNGIDRLSAAADQNGGDLLKPPTKSFQVLFTDDNLRENFRNIVKRSLDLFPVIDPTSLGNLRIRLADSAPSSVAIERGLGKESLEYYSTATPISTASDGIKAFVGILAEVLAGDPEILLIDEPEAFLHPALAFNLGKEISSSLSMTKKRMFASTHSPQFVMGCIQSGVPVNIVRLTYRQGIPSATLLSSETIRTLMRNPLLRSIGVFSALFYESVVLTESDPDRAFYQEINERLLVQGRGIANCLFLNAQNKQTIPAIVEPLRRLGIPTAGIYDVDLVKDDGKVATRTLKSSGFPQITIDSLTAFRGQIRAALDKAPLDFKRSGGIFVLPTPEQEAANHFFDQLDAYGTFVVRGGELESWLKHLECYGHGPSWLISMFEKMGEYPESADYVVPAKGDVWDFMEKVSYWLTDPYRKGMKFPTSTS